MRKINFHIKVKTWKDKKSDCWLIHSKKYDISGYGRTKKQAKKMFEFQLSEIILMSKPKKK